MSWSVVAKQNNTLDSGFNYPLKNLSAEHPKTEDLQIQWKEIG